MCIRDRDVRVIRARKAGTTLDADVERGHDAEDPEGLVAGSAHRRKGSWISNLIPKMLAGGAGEGTCARSTPRSVGSDARASGIIPRMRTALTKQ